MRKWKGEVGKSLGETGKEEGEWGMSRGNGEVEGGSDGGSCRGKWGGGVAGEAGK